MSISLDHSKCFVAADPFDCGQIDACLHEMGYGSVSKGVSHHLFRLKACSDDRADEAFAYIDGAPVAAAD